MKVFLAFPVLLFLLLGTPAFADFQKGLDAANRGDFATALKEWKPLAEQGEADAQFNLGLMYAQGLGVTQNYKTAFKWYKLAAEQGDAAAQNNLGVMYDNGFGVTQDYKAGGQVVAGSNPAVPTISIMVRWGIGNTFGVMPGSIRYRDDATRIMSPYL